MVQCCASAIFSLMASATKDSVGLGQIVRRVYVNERRPADVRCTVAASQLEGETDGMARADLVHGKPPVISQSHQIEAAERFFRPVVDEQTVQPSLVAVSMQPVVDFFVLLEPLVEQHRALAVFLLEQ